MSGRGVGEAVRARLAAHAKAAPGVASGAAKRFIPEVDVAVAAGWRVPCAACLAVVERAMIGALGPSGARTVTSEFIRTNIYMPLLGEAQDSAHGRPTKATNRVDLRRVQRRRERMRKEGA